MESIAGHTQLIENGYLWVDLFFILSGLVLAHVYGEAFARTPRTISYGRFLWLRLTRVYPLYLVTLLLLVGWELYKAHHGIGFYAGPLFKMWEWEGMPPFRLALYPGRGAAKQPVAAAGGDRSRIDLELRRLVAQRGVD